jgi:hypothetical protein
MRYARQKAGKSAGIFGAAADRIHRDIARHSAIRTAQAAGNENPFSQAPRDGLKTTTGRPS